MNTALARHTEGTSASSEEATSPSKVGSFVEVALPMRLSHKWVAYACRTARVGKPRWNRVAAVWTASAVSESGAAESLSITAAADGMSIRILTERDGAAPVETTTARRLATAFVTTMRDAMRHRTMLRESYTRVRAATPSSGTLE